MANNGDESSAAIGRNLALIRDERGLTLRDVCTLLDGIEYPMNVSALSKRELGKLRFSADDLVALARALELPVESLLIPPPDPAEVDQLVDEARALGARLDAARCRVEEAERAAHMVEYEAEELKAAAYRLPRAELVRVIAALGEAGDHRTRDGKA